MNQLLPTRMNFSGSSEPESMSATPWAMPPGFVMMAAAPTPSAMRTISGPMEPMTSTILPRPRMTTPTETTSMKIAPYAGGRW